MFPEIWILGFGNLGLRFLASNYSFVPGRSPELKVQIFRLCKSNLQDRKVDINFRVPSVSSFLEIIRNTHRGKDTERDFLYWWKYHVPKQNLLNQTGRLFLYGIWYIFCQHWNWSWRSIPFRESVFGTPAFVGVIC